MKPTINDIMTEVFKSPKTQETFKRYLESANKFSDRLHLYTWKWNKTHKDNFEDKYID